MMNFYSVKDRKIGGYNIFKKHYTYRKPYMLDVLDRIFENVKIKRPKFIGMCHTD